MMKQSGMLAVTTLTELENLLKMANDGEIIINSFIPNIELNNPMGETVPIVVISITVEKEEEQDE